MIKRIFILLCAGCLPLFSAADLPPVLNSLEGRWVGNFEVVNSQGTRVFRFPVEHRYWIEEGQLRGLATAEIDGELLFTHSASYLLDGQLVSDVVEEGRSTRYLGTLNQGTLTWASTEAGMEVRETLMQKDEKLILKIQYQQELSHPQGERVRFEFTGLLQKVES